MVATLSEAFSNFSTFGNHNDIMNNNRKKNNICELLKCDKVPLITEFPPDYKGKITYKLDKLLPSGTTKEKICNLPDSREFTCDDYYDIKKLEQVK